MLRVFEAFAGVGSQRMALRNLGIDHEVVGIAEIDKFALKSYEAIHGDCPNFGDISKIDPRTLPDMDLFTYSFPCQDLSIAGKQRGMGEGTRSGLLYECEKAIEAKRPKYLLLENVKNLVGKKFKNEFDKWLEYLEGLGYSNYWKVLNAKDYGVPQNRERVFVVSILDSKGYEFPKPIKLDKAIRDILEDEVEERYYMNKPFKLVDKGVVKAEFTEINFEQTKRIHGTDSYFQTLAAKDRGCNNILVERIEQYVEVRKHEVDIELLKKVLKECKKVSGLSNKIIAEKLSIEKTTVDHWFRSDSSFSVPNKEIWFELKNVINVNTDIFDKSITEFEMKLNEFDISNRVYNSKGISPTLMASASEVNASKILIPQATKKGYIEMEVGGVCDLSYPNSKTRRGRVQDGGNVCPTLTAAQQDIVKVEEDYRVRKLTPLECWRLMSFTDEDFYKAQNAGISNSQLYKQAGNSIVVKVLEGIFENLLISINKLKEAKIEEVREDGNYQLKLIV